MDTHGNFLSLMGFEHPDATALAVSQVLQGELGSRLLSLPIAHVKDDHLVPLSGGHPAVARHRVVSAATVPLARVHLELSGEALVQHECPCVVVVVTPGGIQEQV